MKIAWVMQAYQKPELVLEILKEVYRKGDTILLHYDKKSPKSEFEWLKNELSDLSGSKLFCYQKYPVFWGTHLVIWAETFLIKKLLKAKIPFDYMITLTGATIPIKSQENLRGFLQTNYPKSFFKEEHGGELKYGENEVQNHWLNTHHGILSEVFNHPRNSSRPKPNYLKLVIFLRKIVFAIKRRLPKKFLKIFSFPKIYRASTHCIISQKHLKHFFKGWRFHLYSYEIMFLTIPDELFYYTLVRNSTIPLEELEMKSHYTYIDWANPGLGDPAVFDKTYLPILLEQRHFFARKCEDIVLFKELQKLYH
ncbi:MAG: beta-1,6-N-acetylglucosaminyltransferase [Brevinema sp.]